MDSNTRTSQYDKALITISRYGFEISPFFVPDDSNTGKKILSKEQNYERLRKSGRPFDEDMTVSDQLSKMIAEL